VTGYLLLIPTVNGFTLDEVNGFPLGSTEPSVPPPSAEAVAGYLASLPAGQFPNVTAVARHLTEDDPDQRFELLIDLVVDGLAQRAASMAG